MQEYEEQCEFARQNPEGFWADVAENFTWHKKWNSVQSGDFNNVNIRWFEGAKLNIVENCLDRHLATQADKVAIHFEPNNPNDSARKLTFAELHREVCKLANALEQQGVKKGDRICFYMSMLPEFLISILACARIGAVHSVVFAGFSAQSLSERINDSNCKLVFTNDSAMRGTKEIHLKAIVDEALKSSPCVEKVIVYKHTGADLTMLADRDHWYHNFIADQPETHSAAVMDAEDPLFILYTSGSTGKPKGVVHTIAGYMLYTAYSFRQVFQAENNDVFWCTADIGWITGHSYFTYAPLLNGVTQVMFEGIPTFPDAGRFWDICDRYKVTHFYTAPTAIRALEKAGNKFVDRASLNSLKVLGSVGEPINEEAWHWYNEKVGKKKCPIVDTWWQTETGAIMISALAGITPLKPSFATLPLPGIFPELVDTDGNEILGNSVEGNLCISKPWPSMARTIYGDHDRFKQTYFSTYKGRYFTGDGCRRDEDGYYRITGRVDDVINVSGHRIGTAEVENAIDEHLAICETAVVGFPHDIKGQGIFAYMIPYDTEIDHASLRSEILALVSQKIGAIAKPDQILIVSGLPKTRSGKIMRRILRKIAANETDNLGDISTLLDPSVVEQIQAAFAEQVKK
jgi:acetyl-CoA synthetase